jgi:AI-2 transport protein TqsA
VVSFLRLELISENRYFRAKMDSGRSLPVWIIAFAAFSALCYFGATAIITLLLAIMVAYLLDPLATLLERIHIPRGLAIGISMIVAGVIIAALISLLVDRAQDFSANLPNYKTKIQKVSRDVRSRIRVLQKKSEDLSKTIIPNQPPAKQAIPMRVEQNSTLRDFFFRDLGPFYEYIVLISFFPFLVFFLLAGKNDIYAFITNQIRARTTFSRAFIKETSEQIVNDISGKIRGFIIGYLLSTTVIFFAAWVIFLVFGVQLAFIWAFIFALLNILPFVGAILCVVPPILISVLQFNSVETGLLLVGICLLLHLIYSNWLIPRTVGARTQLSPLVVLLAMMYWGFLWGAIGVFLAIPLTASLRSIWLQYRRLQQAATAIEPPEAVP